MSTRVPVNRDRRRPVSPDVVWKFARLCEVGSIHLDCIRRKIRCRSPQRGHVLCSECDESRQLTLELVAHFQLPAVVFSIYEPPSDDLSAAEKYAYWTECLQEAVAEARR